MKAPSNEKMTSFSVVRKKTPFQKHREEEEAKKKRADEEAARLYEEFVESFKAEDGPGGKAFVRGGTINPNERVKHEGAGSKEGSSGSKKPGSRYVPSFIPPGLAAAVNSGKEPEKKKEEEKEKRKDKERTKPRNIDNFMEELKIEQELREKRSQERDHRNREVRQKGNLSPPSRFDELPEDLDPSGKLPGSFDDGDPQTTNLYVGNLAPQVDENFLLRTFGRFGPIASVKIMWPRTDEERRRQRNCGFVAFMNRADAQAAKDEMQGIIVYDYEVRIGWGKAVALPAQALPAPPPGQMAVRSKEGATAKVAWSGPGAPPAPPISSQTAEVVVTPNVPDIEVIPPDDDHIRHVIDTMALYVLDDGCAFEQAIMERGRSHPLFSFLFDLGSKDHTYYVWRLYSFAQGDTLQRWRTEPFIMITGSGRWMPPPLPQQAAVKSPEQEKGHTFAAGRGKRVDQERALTDSQRDEFEDMLRALTLERNLIKEAMGFALDNSEAAGEVVEVLTESLTLKETPIPTKVARLMLVSDILHNSSAPVKNASAYRTKFEASLPDIMESFNELYRSITGRITAEALKERVLKVLQVWSDWFLFSDAYVNGLRATFLRSGNSGVPPFHLLFGDAPPVKDIGVVEDSAPDGIESGQDAALAIGEGAAARELLSLPLAELERRCRHNGLSFRGGREVMVSRLLSLDEAEKQKNQEHDDGLRALQSYGGAGKSTSGRDSEMYRTGGDGRWISGKNWAEGGMGVKEYDVAERFKTDESGMHFNSKQFALENAGNAVPSWSSYDEGEREAGSDSMYDKGIQMSKANLGPLAPTLSIPPPELKVFGTKSTKTDPVLPASKWTREDDDSDGDKVKGLGLSYSSSESEDMFGDSETGGRQESSFENSALAASDTSNDEERRQKLRRLEVAVMEYRESLEDRGIKNIDEIERKVFAHRKKLQHEFGLSDGDGKAEIKVERHTSRSTDRTSSERKDRRDDKRDSVSSKKRPRSRSRSKSPSHTRERLSRDREKEKERDKDSDWDRERDRHREWDAEREKTRSSDAERDREREKNSRDRDDHDRERDRDRDRDREKVRDREREREKDRERSRRRL